METRYDWRRVDLPSGTWTCMYDGPIGRPDETGIVPCCPVVVDGQQCGEIVRRVVYDKRGLVGFEEPHPAYCAGPERHDLRARGAMTLGWRPCDCGPKVRGHRTWTCKACGPGARPLMWPLCARD